jgi:mevalonate kinase
MNGLNKEKDVFLGKIMLFGEYSVMLGSAALTIPLTKYHGRWMFPQSGQPSENESQSNQSARDLLNYLASQPKLSQILDLKSFEDDLGKGMFFNSDIPLAYGAGSSGALVAATYSRYCKELDSNPVNLRGTLALMENHFHGQSSGIDPLSCFIGKPLLFGDDQIQIIDKAVSPPGAQSGIFLIDTKTTGKTGPLVEHFREQMTHYSFFKKVKDVMITETNNCVEAMLNNLDGDFFRSLQRLSEFQYNYMQSMIPVEFMPLWKKGLDQGDFLLKLCGSGGGGFLLGFARDRNAVASNFEGIEVAGLNSEST